MLVVILLIAARREFILDDGTVMSANEDEELGLVLINFGISSQGGHLVPDELFFQIKTPMPTRITAMIATTRMIIKHEGFEGFLDIAYSSFMFSSLFSFLLSLLVSVLELISVGTKRGGGESDCLFY